MEITIKKLKLTNFKGIKSLEIDFGKETNILGKNASGKTTIQDAFNWLLFGKNSEEKTDFEIKRLDVNNQSIPKTECEVEGILMVDRKIVTLRRVLKEKWVKPRGQETEVFSGNDTLFFWNDVPMKAGEYKAEIDKICNEELFKLLTNPFYFNTLHWEKQRDIVMELVPENSLEQVAAEAIKNFDRAEIDSLVKVITEGKTIEQYQKEIAAKRKALQDSLKDIPVRIDEINRNMPEKADELSLNKLIKDTTAELHKVESEIEDISKRNESVLKQKSELQNEIYGIKNEISRLEHEDEQYYQSALRNASSSVDSLKSDLQAEESKLSQKKTDLSEASRQIISVNNSLQAKKKEWSELNATTFSFDENEFKCPACKRDFEADDIEAKKEELMTNFNNDKAAKLEAINKEGQSLSSRLSSLKDVAFKAEQVISEIETKVNSLKLAIDTNSKATPEVVKTVNPGIAVLKEKIDKLQSQIDLLTVDSASSDLKEQKESLRARLTQYNKELAVNDQVKYSEDRIKELESQAKNMGQEKANLERTEFCIDGFIKTKINMVEEGINSLFSMVSFKMFKTLINGGEEPTCQALINGVPYKDANNAAKINSGIDIINALSKHYGITAPIIVDNAESVVKLMDTDSQLVRLVVSGSDEKLRTEVVKEFSDNLVTV